MKLGLGLGLGSGNRLPRYVTDYFNGFELSGSTFSGGPTVVADNTGALVTSPSGMLPIEGMRLATTVAEGAVLGSELAAPTENGEDAENYIESLGNNRYRFVGDGNTATYLRWAVTAYKTYRITVSDVVVTAGSIKCSNEGNGDVFTALTSAGSFDVTSIDNALDVFRNIAGEAIDITATFSVREVIPTWLPTTSLGAPIHASTPLRTRKGTVSVYGEDFRGPLIEPPRTNFLTYSSQFDNAAWVKASGVTVNNLGDGVFRVNFAADGAGIYQGNRVTYTNGSIISRAVWFKSEVSSGAVTTADPGAMGDGTIDHNVTTEWTRFFATAMKAGDGSDGGLWIRKTAGGLSSVLVKFAQVELASFSTSYIPTAATTVTRPAANLTRPTAGTALAALNNWGVRLRFRPTAAGQTAVLWGSYTDANNSIRIDLAASTLTYTKRLAGSNHVAQASLTHAAATLYDVIIYQHGASGMGIAFRSWNGSAWSAWSAWATLTDANGIANAAIASTYQIGALNNASHVSANMPFCHVFELKAALAAQTEIAGLLTKGRI